MALTMERLGVWIGAALTFAIYSFLYKDNPVYKIAEQIFVGISAGYWFIYTIFNILKPNLYTPLTSDFGNNTLLVLPAILGIFMLCRLVPKINWVSRYAISVVVGTTAGLALIRTLQSDVITQMSETIMNPFSGPNAAVILGKWILIIGTTTGIIYFFFSKKHTGAFGATAKLGIVFLMISFGAAFGYTVMARISLLIGRLQYLLGEWLGIIQP
ncbi:MAG: hypothetical protein KGY75_01320 [Candidatus Cloacimonetes bacterium]|nr:hypothetical protein [Candidatus Cloacimonadota bacterium]MBS3766752.1 hypothetical protein [Candidatus Cloacimonadota bacterium]